MAFARAGIGLRWPTGSSGGCIRRSPRDSVSVAWHRRGLTCRRPFPSVGDMRRIWLSLVALEVATLLQAGGVVDALTIPNLPNSLKFAAIGDNGTGQQPEYDVAAQMAAWHQRFSFDMVIMLGDNLYGRQGPADFLQKFERPFSALLDDGVKFYASLGN